MSVPNPDAAPTPVSTWRRIDLGPYLRGEVQRPALVSLARADGVHLFYAGRVHWVSGEPEGMKTWFVLLAAADALYANLGVLYLDFEGEPEEIVERLLALGAPADAIEQHLIYVRPRKGMQPEDLARLTHHCTANPPFIAVIDGVQCAMGLEGKDSNKQVDFYAWWAGFGEHVHQVTTGPTVAIDHVTKDPNTRGRWAAGTGQKEAAVYVHFGVEVIDPFGRGLTGRARLVLNKDKGGSLRQHQARDKTIGLVVLQSDGETGEVGFSIDVPDSGQPERRFRPTVLMERISRYLEGSPEPRSKAAIRAAVPGKEAGKIKAVEVLHEEGHIEGLPRSGYVVYRSVRPYREGDDEEQTDGQ
jgi:AAA domain